MSRAAQIRDFLMQNAGASYSVQEVCRDLGLPTGAAAHNIYTTFNVLQKQGLVTYRLGLCSVSNKRDARLYTWDPVGGAAVAAARKANVKPAQTTKAQPAQQQQQQTAQQTAAPKPKQPRAPRTARAKRAQAAQQQQAQPVNPATAATTLTPDQIARAAARRAAAAAGEAARQKAAEEKNKADLLARAKATFRNMTGVEPAPERLPEMKKAFRMAALKLHPDRNNGIDKGVAVLNAAYSELERAYA